MGRYLIFHKNPPTITLPRSKLIQKKYNDFRLNNKEKKININNYLNNKYLNDCDYSLVLNDFPYDIKNCTHYILWIKNEYFESINSKFDEFINIIISEKFKDTTKYIYFENNINNKSILKK